MKIAFQCSRCKRVFAPQNFFWWICNFSDSSVSIDWGSSQAPRRFYRSGRGSIVMASHSNSFWSWCDKTGNPLRVGRFSPVGLCIQLWRGKSLVCQDSVLISAQVIDESLSSSIIMAPEVGLEPTTSRLTAARSTIELLWMPKGQTNYKRPHRSSTDFAFVFE